MHASVVHSKQVSNVNMAETFFFFLNERKAPSLPVCTVTAFAVMKKRRAVVCVCVCECVCVCARACHLLEYESKTLKNEPVAQKGRRRSSPATGSRRRRRASVPISYGESTCLAVPAEASLDCARASQPLIFVALSKTQAFNSVVRFFRNAVSHLCLSSPTAA